MTINGKIFLLDLYPSSDLSCTLKDILASCTDFDISIQEESVEICNPSLYSNQLLEIVRCSAPDLIIIVLSPGHLERIDKLFAALNGKASLLPIMIVIEDCKPYEVISILKLGVADLFTPPLRAVDILPRIWRLIWQMKVSISTTHKFKERLGLKQMVGKTPAFLNEINKIPLITKCDSNILISGETGTGKELFARAIHYLGPRAGKPFVPVNCGAIPVELVENELFGHLRGAFTGAASSRSGLICDADGGTLFLDEIDCLPPNVQIKLLRFLQDKVYRQLGSTKMCRADIRVIAATNIDLEDAAREGKFRQDLFYRLNVIPLTLPPLRQRREDIPLLANHFLSKYVSEFNKHIAGFTSDAMRKLIMYQWPGNVRELENIVERAVVFSRKMEIESSDIVLPGDGNTGCQLSFKAAKSTTIEKFEKNYVKRLLLAYQGNITKAADAAQKNRRAFWELIRKHRIDVQNFKSGQLQ